MGCICGTMEKETLISDAIIKPGEFCYNAGLQHQSREEYNEMKRYFNLAVERGNVNAMYNLAVHYKDMEEDYVMAKKYFRLAIAHNHEWKEYIIDMMKNGTGLLYDFIKQNIKSIEKLKKVFEYHEENTHENECVICFEKHINTLNFKCNNKHDHYYCLECFCKWYNKKRDKQCILCLTDINLDDIILCIKI